MSKPLNLKAFTIAALRRASYKWPPRYTCMNAARVERGKYRCAECTNIVGRKDIKIDHKIPVVGPEGFTTWDAYIPRLYCEEINFQALCDPCHKAKTKLETAERKKKRVAKKVKSVYSKKRKGTKA